MSRIGCADGATTSQTSIASNRRRTPATIADARASPERAPASAGSATTIANVGPSARRSASARARPAKPAPAISTSTRAGAGGSWVVFWVIGDDLSRGAPCATSDPTPQAKRRRNRSPRMSSAINDVLDILNLERLEVNLFRGRSPQAGWQRVFGGQVIGQALGAALRTVENRPPHSMHAYFLLPGDPKVPIVYDVDRIRDGRSFTTRRVVAIQHGQAIFSMAVSVHRDEPGLTHQAKMPSVPDPGELPSEAGIKERVLAQ